MPARKRQRKLTHVTANLPTSVELTKLNLSLIHISSEPTIISRPGLLTTNNPFYFEGKWGERRDGKYIIHEGFVTDCRIPKPWWRLTSTKFDITPNDRCV